jgi:quinol monooxygenase YgiN
MEGILLHVLYRGEKANDFASEMERSGLRAAVLAEEGCMQYDYYRPLAEENCVLLVEHWRDRAALDKHSAGSRWQSSRRSRQATTSQRPLSALNEEKRIRGKKLGIC